MNIRVKNRSQLSNSEYNALARLTFYPKGAMYRWLMWRGNLIVSVAREAKKEIGWAAVYGHDDEPTQDLGVFVDPKYRGRGVAKALTKTLVESIANLKRYRGFVFEFDDTAVGLFKPVLECCGLKARD